LQTLLSIQNQETIQTIFQEIFSEVSSLMIHPYGNYFCQKFYPFLDLTSKLKFIKSLGEDLYTISNSQIGSYPLQTIIENLSSKVERELIIHALNKGNDYLFKMCFEQFSSHVIEKVADFPEEEIEFLFEFSIKNFNLMASSQSALCILKRIIKNVKKQSTKKEIQKIITNNFFNYINHPFANYTIQMALQYWEPFYLTPIFDLFCGKFSDFSLFKYSSNVVEKCLEKGGDAVRCLFIKEIIQFDYSSVLIKSNYGNYVIQKALSLANLQCKAALTFNIINNLERIGDTKLIYKWKQICHLNIEEINQAMMVESNKKRLLLNSTRSMQRNNQSFHGGSKCKY